jgi:hypothetical protein
LGKKRLAFLVSLVQTGGIVKVLLCVVLSAWLKLPLVLVAVFLIRVLWAGISASEKQDLRFMV